MRKFKHKTKDIILVKCKNGNSYSSENWEGYYIPSEFVENSNDWEEVIEKDYEILSLISTDGDKKIITYGNGGGCYKKDFFPNVYKSIDYWVRCFTLNSNPWTIHSVKRVLDGEVFTVGDTLDFNEKGDGILIRIDFERAPADKGTGKLCFVNDNKLLGGWWGIKELHKVKTPLLVTEDGVEIFEESQLIWDTSDINWDFLDTTPAIHMKSIIINCSHRKAWAKKENAERYIELNSPKYSVLDMLKVANHYAYIKNVTEDRILKYLAKNEK